MRHEPETRPTAEALLAKFQQAEHARLRVYIGAAPGVGKTYQMLEDAHLLRKQGADVIIGVTDNRTSGQAAPSGGLPRGRFF